jgi:hypothetical protein
MLDIPNPAANAAAAAAINARVAAQAAHARAKARIWTLAGVGALLALSGVGAGFAFAGYNTRIEHLRTESATVKLDSTGTTTKLDSSGDTVKLDTNGAKVKLDANNAMLPQVATTAPQSGAKVVTDYVIHNQVKFPDHYIETIWHFNTSNDTAPDHERCRYVNNLTDYSALMTEIAIDHIPHAVEGKNNFNVQEALSNCVWFKAEAEPPAPPPLTGGWASHT